MTPRDAAAAYLAAPRAPSDAIRAYAHLAVSWVPPVRLAVIDADPYGGAHEMAQRVVSDGCLYVWSGASDGLAWEPSVNHRLRALHDVLDHLRDGPVPFDFAGESEACRRACARTPGLAPLIRSEVLGQVGYVTVHGAFPVQRAGWLA